METYIGIGLLTCFIGIFVVGILLGKKRKKALRQLAKDLNFSFDETFSDEDDALLKSLSHLAFFRQSSSQGAWNVMRGQSDDVTVTIMDHRYSSGSGNTRQTSEQTVIVVQSEHLRLPTFTLRAEDLGHKISTAVLGYRDIDFDDHPAFSKQYHLHGVEEESIRHIFNEDVLAYFERNREMIADGSGDSLMYCRLCKTVAVKDIQSFLAEGFKLFSLFKGESETASLHLHEVRSISATPQCSDELFSE